MDIDYINSKKMNFLKKYYILLILFSTTCFVQFIKFYENNQLKKGEEKLDIQSDIIEMCIDFENKNKRSIYENIKLSEYCINNFGIIKLSQQEIICKNNDHISFISSEGVILYEIPLYSEYADLYIIENWGDDSFAALANGDVLYTFNNNENYWYEELDSEINTGEGIFDLESQTWTFPLYDSQEEEWYAFAQPNLGDAYYNSTENQWDFS